MCCDNTGYKEKEIDGECSNCGEPTVGGDAYDQCYYSPVECETCNFAPCDGSC